MRGSDGVSIDCPILSPSLPCLSSRSQTAKHKAGINSSRRAIFTSGNDQLSARDPNVPKALLASARRPTSPINNILRIQRKSQSTTPTRITPLNPPMISSQNVKPLAVTYFPMLVCTQPSCPRRLSTRRSSSAGARRIVAVRRSYRR